LSFERLVTSLIVASKPELVVQLFAKVGADHGIAAHHVVNIGGGLVVITFAAAVGAVVGGIVVEAVSLAVTPICLDGAQFGAFTRWWLRGRRPWVGKGSRGRMFGLYGGSEARLEVVGIFGLDASSKMGLQGGGGSQVSSLVASACSGDFAFTLGVGRFKVDFRIGPRLLGVWSFLPMENRIFKVASLLDVVERFAHCAGFGDGILASGG
jgi:hypothetical protein